MSHLAPLPRCDSRASIAASVTTYHSFRDVELYEPAALSSPSPQPTVYYDARPVGDNRLQRSATVRRQDSGYESLDPKPAQSSRRRASTATSGSSALRLRARPSSRRMARPVPALTSWEHAGELYQPYAADIPSTFFQFPSSQSPVYYAARPVSYPGLPRSETPVSREAPRPTTHYWTSDRTRRLEYAAIDAASRGVKGWVLKHMVPECFVPKERRRVGFEDDGGSVRRYRLELEHEDSGEKVPGEEAGKKKWGLFKGA